MRTSSIAGTLLFVLLFAHSVRADEGPFLALDDARMRLAALRADPVRLKLRHQHEAVIRAWARARRLADSAPTRIQALRGEAEAWALLAHWSGRADDAARARTLKATLAEAERVRPSAMLAAIIADVRRTYPDVVVEPAAPPAPPKPPSRPAVAPTRAPRGPADLTIVVDPGHGGRDKGTTGIYGRHEKALNLALARGLARQLRAALGARVVLTRNSDRFVSLGERIRRANAVDADLFISVHANAHRSAEVEGLETFYYRRAPRGRRGARRLAHLMQTNMIRSLTRRYRPVRSLGTKASGFQVLRGVRMPAVLIEAGFLTHPVEAKRLRQAGYRRVLIRGMVRAVQRFLDRPDNVAPESVADMSANESKRKG